MKFGSGLQDLEITCVPHSNALIAKLRTFWDVTWSPAMQLMKLFHHLLLEQHSMPFGIDRPKLFLDMLPR